MRSTLRGGAAALSLAVATMVVASTQPDALETAIGLAEEVAEPGEAVSGAGVVVTGSVVTAGVARSLFGKDPA